MNTVTNNRASELNNPTASLAGFVADMNYQDFPRKILEKSKTLFLDWIGCALAGKGARPVESLANFLEQMGRTDGGSEILIHRKMSSPMISAMINAASSHFVEQDDVHNGSVFHPGTIVFPVALAIAQDRRLSGREFLCAVIAGYEVGIRVGEFLGRSHYKIFHTTATAGTLAAAACASRLLRLDSGKTLDAFGSAGTQAAGFWQFLRDGADSKQLHTAHAVGTGLMSAYLAADGFRGAKDILGGEQGMASGMSDDPDPARLIDGLGERWAISETSFKYHASCRHTHPAADALADLMRREGLIPARIARVKALVHQAAIDVLGPVTNPQNVHQAKFSMGTVLGLIAEHGAAGLREFDAYYDSSPVADFRRKVDLILDDEVEARYPQAWVGKIAVETVDGKHFENTVIEPKGDPGNTLSNSEVLAKALSLSSYGGAASEAELGHIAKLAKDLEEFSEMPLLLPA